MDNLSYSQNQLFSLISIFNVSRLIQHKFNIDFGFGFGFVEVCDMLITSCTVSLYSLYNDYMNIMK